MHTSWHGRQSCIIANELLVVLFHESKAPNVLLLWGICGLFGWNSFNLSSPGSIFHVMSFRIAYSVSYVSGESGYDL